MTTALAFPDDDPYDLAPDATPSDLIRERIAELKSVPAETAEEAADETELADAEKEAALAEAGPLPSPTAEKVTDPEAAEELETHVILNLDALRQLPPVQYLLAGKLVEGEINLLSGPPGHMKTFLALDWALHISAGTPWQDHSTKQAVSLYCAGEDVLGVAERVNAWTVAHESANVQGFGVINKALQLLSADKLQQSKDIHVMRNTLRVLKRKGVRRVFILVDTLSRSIAGHNENAPDVMSGAIAALDVLREERDEDFTVTILVLAHTAKDGQMERGHSALRGAVATITSCKKDEAGVVLVTCERTKNLPDWKPMFFELTQSANSAVLTTTHRTFGKLAGVRRQSDNGFGQSAPF